MMIRFIFVVLTFLLYIPFICGSSEHTKVVSKYPDTNDYKRHPVCGNKPLAKSVGTCYCGSEALSGVGDLILRDTMCCLSPEDQCFVEGSNVRCPNGTKHLKSLPCHNQCYNSFTQSEYLWWTSRLYCEEEDFCLHIRQVCTGVCKTEEQVCASDLRCTYHGYEDLVKKNGWANYTVQSLGGRVTGDHDYCLAINNDGFYDTISRKDEDKVTTKDIKLFDYKYLTSCPHKVGEGINCQEGCKPINDWCSGTGGVCTTTGGPVVGKDYVDLCRNNAFWLNRSCDWWDKKGLMAAGTRCTADTKHCSFPWYSVRNAAPWFSETCLDLSDKAFPVNTSCDKYNARFIDTYKTIWCGEGGTGLKCDNLEEFFASQKGDNRIRDPHGCEQSCSTTGANCLACQHEDYFHCQTTGICIHHSNVCNGHHHPQCGGDDEIMDDCYNTYVKRRIVKNYATFICNSVMYPGKVILQIYLILL